MQNLFKLAMQANLPLIWVKTDDPIHVEEVLSFLNDGKKVTQVTLPTDIVKSEELIGKLKGIKETVLYTSSECKSLVKLWKLALEADKTIVFVNTEKSVLQFDGGTLIPPKELVLQFLKDMGDVIQNPEELLPALGGMTLKDVLEVCRMTITRDESVSARGINETRRGYSSLQGIVQVDTAQDFYVRPALLDKWLKFNTQFFKAPKHPSLMPRGLLFDGPPGTGKTAASKSIAEQFGVPLYRLDLGAMMGKYVGESEGNLNAALSQLDEVAPCVAILGEVEKVFQGQSDSGVTSRLLSQLLWWLQEHKSKVFTVMTTNDVKAIKEELWRPGRIDKKMDFLGIQNKTEGLEFARAAFDTLMGAMSFSGKPADYKILEKRVAVLFNDGAAVPQAKITITVSDLVRECLSENTNED